MPLSPQGNKQQQNGVSPRYKKVGVSDPKSQKPTKPIEKKTKTPDDDEKPQCACLSVPVRTEPV